MNYELKIDRRVCDVATHACLIPGLTAERLAQTEAARNGRALTLPLPRTPRNEAILQHPHDSHTPGRFNASLHHATLDYGGERLFEGTVRLLATSEEGYRIEIREGGSGWAKRAATAPLSSLNLPVSLTLTPTKIVESWYGESPLRYFPIHRDAYTAENSQTDLLPLVRILSTDDYHPFLHLASVIEAIFGEAGYAIESDFFGSEEFQTLYMSGAYATRNTLMANERMGFLAGRLSDAQAEADPTGRVYLDPLMISNTLGNPVETATPHALDAQGEPVEGLYNNGNCFKIADNGRIAFVPLGRTAVGFEYHIRYTTQHRIRNRHRLTGFDTLYLGNSCEFSFELANRYEDRRGEPLRRGFAYRVVVFDHEAGNRYRLVCDHSGDSQVVWEQFEGRTARVVTPYDADLAHPQLEVWSIDHEWRPYPLDWALYDGYIEEVGETVVELRLSTPAEVLEAHQPHYFHQAYLACAEPGMTVTLHRSTTLKPIFRSSPGLGSVVTFADVTAHPMRQLELVAAVAHLFNLRFLTDERRKTVRIEPAEGFYAAHTLDWRRRTDFSQPVERKDIAPEIHELRTWGYQEGDGAVQRFERATGERFGSWTAEADTTAAKVGNAVVCNPIFAPTMNDTGNYAHAPSASLMQMGDRDQWAEEESVTPRIVRYAGLHTLPEREQWSYPAGREYPLAAFHFAGDEEQAGFTLCFEDRDGIDGLNRYYRPQCAREATSERITLTLHFTPQEYAQLFATAGSEVWRARILIETGSDEVQALLHEVGNYDPVTQRLTGTFERI